MKRLDQKPTHTLLLVNDGTVAEADFKALAQNHSAVFETVYIRTITPPTDRSWPSSVNHVFRTIARALISSSAWVEPSQFSGWVYFEPDVTPLAPIWIEILDQQYEFNKKPFMGVKSIVQAKRGDTPTTVTCMNGAGCYPFDPSHFTAVMLLADGAPWDVLGLSERDYVISYIPDSAYTLTYGITKCARRIDGEIEATKTVQDGSVSQIHFALAEQILHHGCKDGSLIELFEKEKEVKTKSAGRTEPAIRKTASRSKARLTPEEQKAAIIADRRNGVGWNDLIGKYRISPKNLSALLKEAAGAPA